VRVNIDSVVIATQSQISQSQLASFKSGKVLIFGSEGPGEIRPYEKTSVDGILIIKSDSLSNLNDITKKSLWGALKQMFPG
jgi:hypothetical protein